MKSTKQSYIYIKNLKIVNKKLFMPIFVEIKEC